MEYSHGYGAMFEICDLYGRSKASEAAVRPLITLMIKVERRPCDWWNPTNALHPIYRAARAAPCLMDQRPFLMPHVSCIMPPHAQLQHDVV